MLKITILAVGTIKEKYWTEALAEYEKRLQPFSNLEIRELKDESFSAKDNPEVVMAKEADAIKKALPERAFVIALDEHGIEFDSVGFAKKLDAIKLEHSHIVFIIGGVLGLHSSVFEHVDLKLSLSKSTITHQMVRVTLLEQIYRACMISSNRPYHH